MNIVVGIMLVLLGIEDYRTQKLFLWPVMGMLILAGVYAVCTHSFMQCISGVLPGSCLLILSLVQPEAIGIADALVAMMYGLVFGGVQTCIWLMCSFLLVAIVGIFWKLFRKTRKIRLPFVPFMAFVQMGMCL